MLLLGGGDDSIIVCHRNPVVVKLDFSLLSTAHAVSIGGEIGDISCDYGSSYQKRMQQIIALSSESNCHLNHTNWPYVGNFWPYHPK